MATMDSAEILQALRAIEKKLDACLAGQQLLGEVIEELADEILGSDEDEDEEEDGAGSLVEILREVADAALEETGKQARKATRRRR